MLKPSMKELLAQVGNRYLLVNLAAQRARDIAQESEESNEALPDKAVKLALDEIAAGTIVYCPGPKIEPEISMPSDLAGTLEADLTAAHEAHEAENDVDLLLDETEEELLSDADEAL